MGEENLSALAFEPAVRSWQLAFYCVGLLPLALVCLGACAARGGRACQRNHAEGHAEGRLPRTPGTLDAAGTGFGAGGADAPSEQWAALKARLAGAQVRTRAARTVLGCAGCGLWR